LRHAEETRRHRFTFFGQVFQYGDSIDWQADPVTGRGWPARYHADVPVHSGDVGCGDVKHVWELSRQQYLVDLGKAFFVTGDRENVRAMEALVHSWMAGNPYATGVNWGCALEPAFRVFSWLWTYYLTVDALDEAFHLRWLRGFHDHGRFLARHLEQYSSPYNHLIGEAAALYMLGACFPEFERADAWRESGRFVLERRLREQFYADGGSVEQSTFYHHATVGFYLLAALTARAVGEDLSPGVWRAIEQGLDFSMALVQPDGTTPRIGGADDGKPIRMEYLPFWDFRPYHAAGAVLFNRGDFKQVAGRFHEDSLWLLGPAGVEQFDAIPAAAPRDSTRALAASGYYVLRSDWSPSADYVCFDCGEQAAGMRPDGIPNSMHGHADCLSVIVWLAGRPVLIDSGLYAYNCGGAWEAHFRETAAHNTARIDGQNQATHLGKMAWSHSYRASAEGWTSGAEGSWVVGSHDGYARPPIGITHRRTVWLRPGGYVIVYDEFLGPAGHDIEVNFQFAPGALATSDSTRALFGDAVDLVATGNTSWQMEKRAGGDAPEDGWVCRSLGVAEPAPRLTMTARSVDGRTLLITVLGARHTIEPRLYAVSTDTPAVAPYVGIATGDDDVEWILADGIAPAELIATDAKIVVCRVRNGVPVVTATAAGTYATCDASRWPRLEWPAAIAGGRTR
jgi:hypothetical protein